jgi:hypothetical protein
MALEFRGKPRIRNQVYYVSLESSPDNKEIEFGRD